MTFRLPPSAMVLALSACCATVFVPALASGQTSVAVKPEPRLPGAVETLPGWLKDAPFDASRFFGMPAASQNAAPLYIDAFSEFGTDLESLATPDVRKRSEAIARRSKQLGALYDVWTKDPSQVDRAALDAVLAECKEGFRKLDLAQKRPRCVFAIGVTLDTRLPHAQLSRNVTRALMMRASRALDRDELDSAIGDLGRVLRMSRDLRPRGVVMCQVVSLTFDSITCKHGITPFLAHRRLKVDHCDRLIKLMAGHEDQAIDPFTEAMKSEYVINRTLLRLFAEGIKITVAADGRPVETRPKRADIDKEVFELFRMIGATPDPAKVAAMKLTDPPNLAKDRKAFDDSAKSMLAVGPLYQDRIRQAKALEKTYIEGRPNSLYRLQFPDYAFIAMTCSRDLVFTRGTQCQVALRRWQLTHTAPPTDLAEVCKAANLSRVPIDPFSGAPLKMAVIDGEPVVYSIGPDGIDDRGLIDSEMGQNPAGDLIFRLPKRK